MNAPIRQQGWTSERETAAIEMWKRGLSATQIASFLGGGISRNAVIGKMHRKGIEKPQLGPTGKSLEGRPRRTGRHLPPHREPSLAPLRAISPRELEPAPPRALTPRPAPAPAPIDFTPPEDAPRGAIAAIAGLRTRSCRWGFGDTSSPAFRFCCAATVEGRPYCAHHWAKAHVPGKPPPERRRAAPPRA